MKDVNLVSPVPHAPSLCLSPHILQSLPRLIPHSHGAWNPAGPLHVLPGSSLRMWLSKEQRLVNNDRKESLSSQEGTERWNFKALGQT